VLHKMNRTRTERDGREKPVPPKRICNKGNFMSAPVQRRRPPKIDTERKEAKRACARHLKDLRQAHGEPPADVKVPTRRTPRFVAPILEQSYCTSPAALCAELAE